MWKSLMIWIPCTATPNTGIKLSKTKALIFLNNLVLKYCD